MLKEPAWFVLAREGLPVTRYSRRCEGEHALLVFPPHMRENNRKSGPLEIRACRLARFSVMQMTLPIALGN